MDKYEYRVKTEQMLEYMEQKMYKKAMEIADTIDWRRVKNSTMLSTVSEIYECNGEYQKSRDILFVAYDRSPGSRKIVYRLGTLAVKVDDLQEAMDCYEEFIALAPKDPNQYILKYKILKAQNAPKEQQIEALVDFKKVEYVEKWAYELAKLYHEAGLIAECLEECDDLILWFSEGKYVFQAMELKMRHKPLTPLQQEKYNQCLAEHTKEKFKKPEQPKQEAVEKEPVQEETIVIEETAQIPEEDMGATRKIELPEEVVEEVSEEQAEAPVEEETVEVAVEEVVEEEAKTESIIKQTIVGATLEEALAKGVAAAAGIELPEEPEEEFPEIEIPEEEEPQTAQEKIEGILQDWEEKQREVEREIEEKRQQAEAERAEREAKRKEMAEQNMFNQAPIIPDDIQKLLEELENGIMDSDVSADEEVVDNQVSEEQEEEIVIPEELVAELHEDIPEAEEVIEEPAEEPVAEEPVVEEPVVEEPAAEEPVIEEVIVEEFEIPVVEEEPEEEVVVEEPVVEKTALEQLEEEIAAEKAKRSPGGVTFDTGFVVQGRYDLEAQSEIGLKAGLTEEQKKLFSYFVPVRGMSEQIVEVLHNDKDCKTRYGTSRTGNILVVGRQGTGKTVLAVNIVKAIQKARRLKQGKVAIVTGEALNKKELSSVMGKLKGGALIIEKAGKMNPRTVQELNDLMEEQTGELLIVLEEQRKPLEKLLASNADFKRKFTSKLELPIFINDELVTFGQTYAKENGYKIDEMGILALYSRIDLMQKEDHAVTVAEVKDIIDDAIENAQKANVKHLVKRVFGKRKDNADRVILTEQDFK